MSFFSIILTSTIIILCNIIITAILIGRNNVTSKILNEIKVGVKSLINELDHHMLLAEDIKNELLLQIKTIENLTNKTVKKDKLHDVSSKKKDNDTDNKKNLSQSMTKEYIALISLLLEKGESDKQIIETLNVSLQEINMVKILKAKNKK